MNNSHRGVQGLHVRWCVARDLPQIVTIEADCPAPWSEDDYRERLRDRTVISMAAEDNRTDEVMGVMVYQLHATHLGLLRLVVKKSARREGVGGALVAKLLYKVVSHRREAVYCRVPEDNLSFQLFLRSCGFNALAVIGSDYLFERHATASEYDGVGQSKPVNRISKWEGKR